MKFGARLEAEAFPEFKSHYIAYKDLKKAIKLITGSDTSHFTISEVTTNFGNIPALAGSQYRPPESRFQDLLNFEVSKINSFSAIVYSSISSTLRALLKRLVQQEVETKAQLRAAKESADSSARDVVRLYAYVRLNLTGFRKITKKYDKHHKTTASAFYLAGLLKERFVNLDFNVLLALVSATYAELRRAHRRLQEDEPEVRSAEDLGLGPLTPVGTVTAEDEDTQHFVVPGDSAMLLRVELAKYATLTSIAGVQCESLSAALSSPPSFEAKPAASEPARGDLANPDRQPEEAAKRLTKTSLNLRPGGQSNDSAIYNYETNQVDCGFIYFDVPYLNVYRSLVDGSYHRAPHQERTKVARLRWRNLNSRTPASDQDPSSFILEIIDFPERASAAHENAQTAWPNSNSDSQLTNALVVSTGIVLSLLEGKADVLRDLYASEMESLDEKRRAEMETLIKDLIHIFRKGKQMPTFQVWLRRTTFARDSQACFAYLDDNICFQDVPTPAFCRTLLEKGPNSRPSSLLAPSSGRVGGSSDATRTAPLQQQNGILCVSSPGKAFLQGRPSLLTNVLDTLLRESCIQRLPSYSVLEHGTALCRADRQLGRAEHPQWLPLVMARDEDDLEDAGGESESPKLGASVAALPPSAATGGRGAVASSQSLRRSPSGMAGGSGSQSIRRRTTLRMDALPATTSRARLLYEPESDAPPPHTAAAVAAGEYVIPGASVINIGGSLDSQRGAQGGAGFGDRMGALFGGGREYRSLVPSHNAEARTPFLQGMSSTGLAAAPSSSSSFVAFFNNIGSVTGSAWGAVLAWLHALYIGAVGGSSRRALGEDGSSAVRAAAVRVEPKTFFANERTLLQWMNTAVLLSTISVTLLNFGTPTGRTAGLIMAPVALFFILYSFSVYLKRSYSLERKEPIDYNDRVGPTVLVLSLCCALTAVILLNIAYGPNAELTNLPTSAPSEPPPTSNGEFFQPTSIPSTRGSSSSTTTMSIISSMLLT